MTDLYNLIANYIEEVPSPQSSDVMWERIKTGDVEAIPLLHHGGKIGFFTIKIAHDDLSHWSKERLQSLGLNHLSLDRLKRIRVATIEAVYLLPEHRGKFFFKIFPKIISMLDKKGFDIVQSDVKPDIAKWLMYRYSGEPYAIRLVGNPKFLMKAVRGDA